MKKILLLILVSFKLLGQDTLIDKKIYISYYSFVLKAPIYTKHKLYKGGGDCSRDGDSFKNEKMQNRTAVNKDYYNSGYDKGHCVSSEDLAYNCEYQELTFRYWNCFPQTPELNRGIWKKYETDIRKLSQTDSLIILTGGFYSNKYIGKGVYVPDSCWKVVQSLTTKKIIYCLIFTNTDNPVVKNISLNSLNKYINKKYKINIKKLLK